jgi:hypothetical protein
MRFGLYIPLQTQGGYYHEQHLYTSTSCRECYGGYGHDHILLTSFLDGTLRSAQILRISISAATLDGRTRQQSHFPQHNRSVRLDYTQFVG